MIRFYKIRWFPHTLPLISSLPSSLPSTHTTVAGPPTEAHSDPSTRTAVTERRIFKGRHPSPPKSSARVRAHNPIKTTLIDLERVGLPS